MAMRRGEHERGRDAWRCSRGRLKETIDSKRLGKRGANPCGIYLRMKSRVSLFLLLVGAQMSQRLTGCPGYREDRAVTGIVAASNILFVCLLRLNE
jgi:hypothetical protein